MIDTPSGLWWLALIQFVGCGLCAMVALAIPKFHHFPADDKPLILGIVIFFAILSVFGLIFMSVN